jgi:8-oxo-dGTP pyrophosphatase MutT (NUDIX family)
MRGWHFPGGGVGKRESVLAALYRELKEEVGVVPTAAPELLGVYTNFADPRASHVAFYKVTHFEMTPKRNLEIAEWRFFPPDALPENTGRGPVNRRAEYRGERAPDGLW